MNTTQQIFNIQAQILFICANIAVIGNLLSITMIVFMSMKIQRNKLIIIKKLSLKYRRANYTQITSSPSHILLVHHCILAALRALLCIHMIQTPVTVNSKWKLYSKSPDLHCVFISGIYFLLLTVNVFNVLAIAIAEAYRYTEKSGAVFVHRSKTNWARCCCAAFAMITLWFGAVIVNLGVTFVPIDHGSRDLLSKWKQSHEERDDKYYTMTCALDYGVASGYGTKVLRGILVVSAIAITIAYLYKFRLELSKHRHNLGHRSDMGIHEKRLLQIQSRSKYHLHGIEFLVLIFALGWIPYFVELTLDPLINSNKCAEFEIFKRTLALMAWSLDVSITPLIIIGYLVSILVSVCSFDTNTLQFVQFLCLFINNSLMENSQDTWIQMELFNFEPEYKDETETIQINER